MSGYGYGGGYGAPPYGPPYGEPPSQYGYPSQPGPYPPPPGGYPPPPGGYPPPPGGYPPPPGDWTPPNRGYGWYQWERPSHCSGEFYWIHCEAGQIPHNAVHAGRDKDGGPLFAGRAYYDDDLLPAKVAPHHHHAYVSYGGREHVIHKFEVLVSHHVAWVQDCHGRVPPEAIVVGQTCDGENLFMGRVMHDGTLTPGKIQPSHQCLYIPYGGDELKYREYEVMVLN